MPPAVAAMTTVMTPAVTGHGVRRSEDAAPRGGDVVGPGLGFVRGGAVGPGGWRGTQSWPAWAPEPPWAPEE